MGVSVRARVYPTEDGGKVEAAVKNLFEVEVRKEGSYLVGSGSGLDALKKIRLLLASQGIRDSAREIFLKNAEGDTLSFRLNKQAAYAGAVNFAASSHLGPIYVTISDADISGLIHWLAPEPGGKH